MNLKISVLIVKIKMISKIKNLIHIIRKMSNFDEINFKIGCSHFNLMKNYYPNNKNFFRNGLQSVIHRMEKMVL